MLTNRAIIPLYINADMLNNLFTIVIQEFVETKSASTKDVISIHLKTPLSELSYDLFGKYMQGELELQIQNEFVKQKTEQSMSMVIVVLKQLKDILSTQGLLKRYDTDKTMNSIEINDYVEFPCRLRRNPIVQNVINTINMLQLGGAMNVKQDEITLDALPGENDLSALMKREEFLNYLRSSLDEHKQQRCIRYIAESIENPTNKYIVPLKSSSLIDNEDYLLNGKVTILGKVINKIEDLDITTADESKRVSRIHSCIRNDAFFDNIDFNKISKHQYPFLKSSLNYNDANLINNFNPKCEILPLAIYI